MLRESRLQVALPFDCMHSVQETKTAFSLERMPRLLYRLLITLQSLAVLNILLQPLPPLPQRAQFSAQNERNREVHLDIGHGDLVAKQEFAIALLKLRSHEVQVILDVLRKSDFCFLGIAGLLMPAGVHDRDGVESECTFCGVDPLKHVVALGVADGWQ